MIKCIMFDLGGVILNDIMYRYYDYLTKELKTERAKLESFAAPRIAKMEAGRLDVKTFLRSAAKHFNTTQKSLLWKDAVYLWMKPNENIIRLVRSLRRRYKLVLLSNIDRSDYFLQIRRFDKDLFDKRFLSCYLHIRKPDERIYKIALNTLKVKPEEVVFIDDSPANVRTARELGIEAILFVSYQRLLKDLRKIGVFVGNGFPS